MLTVKTLKKNTVIFREGEVGNTMYDIWWGKVGIYSGYGTSDQKLLATLGEDAFFGEMGMIENLPRSATAVTLEETQVQIIDMENFEEYLKQKPAKVHTILEHTSSRLRELSVDYVEAYATISQYVAAEKAGEKPSKEIIEKLKKIEKKSKGRK